MTVDLEQLAARAADTADLIDTLPRLYTDAHDLDQAAAMRSPAGVTGARGKPTSRPPTADHETHTALVRSGIALARAHEAATVWVWPREPWDALTLRARQAVPCPECVDGTTSTVTVDGDTVRPYLHRCGACAGIGTTRPLLQASEALPLHPAVIRRAAIQLAGYLRALASSRLAPADAPHLERVLRSAATAVREVRWAGAVVQPTVVLCGSCGDAIPDYDRGRTCPRCRQQFSRSRRAS